MTQKDRSTETPPLDLNNIPTATLQRMFKQVMHYRARPKPYHPHAKQLLLHKSMSKVIVASAGNRGGKSDAGCNELVWRVTGTHPYKRIRTPNKATAASYDFKHGIDKIIAPKIMAALDSRMIDSVHRTQGIIDHIDLINGSKIEFKSYTQPSTLWEGDDQDFYWFDEPPPREHYIAARRGLVDRNGDALITATMVNDPWISNELIEPALEGNMPGVEIITWSSYDNPYIDHEAMRAYELSLPPEIRPVRIYGKIFERTGRVIKRFRNAEPFIIPDYDWPSHLPWFELLDPHASSPKGHYWLRIGVLPRGDLVVFHAEITPADHGTMPELAQAILRSRDAQRLGTPVIPTISDNSINIYDPQIKRNLKDWLELSGVPTTMASKRDKVTPGYEEINQMLWRTEQNDAGGIYIMKRTTEVVGGGLPGEWKQLVWDDRENGKTKGPDDFTDLVRYLAVMDPRSMVDKDYFANIPAMKHDYTTTVTKRMKDISNKEFDYDKDEDDEPTTPEQYGFTFGKSKYKRGYY